MGIPVFHQIMLPLLQLLEDKQEHSLRQVIDSLTNQEHDEYCKTQAHTLDLHFRTPPRSIPRYKAILHLPIPIIQYVFL